MIIPLLSGYKRWAVPQSSFQLSFIKVLQQKRLIETADKLELRFCANVEPTKPTVPVGQTEYQSVAEALKEEFERATDALVDEGNAVLLEQYLQKGPANVFIEPIFQLKLINQVSRYASLEQYKTLLPYFERDGILPDKESLDDALGAGNCENARFLMDGRKIQPDNKSLAYAVYSGRLDLVRYLVEEKKIPVKPPQDPTEVNPLAVAAREFGRSIEDSGNRQSVSSLDARRKVFSYLCDQPDINLNSREETPGEHTSRQTLIMTLLQEYAVNTSSGKSGDLWAYRAMEPGILKLVQTFPVDVNYADAYGDTVLDVIESCKSHHKFYRDDPYHQAVIHFLDTVKDTIIQRNP